MQIRYSIYLIIGIVAASVLGAFAAMTEYVNAQVGGCSITCTWPKPCHKYYSYEPCDAACLGPADFCSDGSWTCTSCPTTSTSSSSTSAPPSCDPSTETNPNKPVLSGPGVQTPTANPPIVDTNNPRFTWNDTDTNWGISCYPSNSYNLQLRDMSLATPVWVGYGDVRSVSNLKWNTKYRWRVVRSNGSRTIISDVYEFITSKPPVIENVQITSGTLKCAADYSGRSSYTTTNNPLFIQFDVYDELNNFNAGVNRFRQARVAIAGAGGVQTTPYYSLNPNLYDTADRRAGFRVQLNGINVNAPVGQYASVNAVDGSYGAEFASGNLTNATGNVTLVGLNDASFTSITRIDNQRLRIKFALRFEDQFAAASSNIYVSVFSRTTSINAVNVSQDPNPSDTNGDGNLQYTLFRGWNFDLTPPTAVVNNPVAGVGNNFTVNWQATDNIGIRTGGLSSYCYKNDSTTGSIVDVALGQVISLGATPINYPSADNCLVNDVTRLGNRSYQDNNGTMSGGMVFALYAEDVACNPAFASAQSQNASPWMMTGGGNVRAANGFASFTVRNVPAATLSAISNNLGSTAYLARFLAISGNTSMLTSRQSQMNAYVTGYTDQKVIPPPAAGSDSWFAAIANALQGRMTTSAATVINGNFSTTYGVAASSKGFFFHNGNLTINANASCDIKAIIVINGTLTINPNLNALPLGGSPVVNTNGCMFVTKGDITVNAGSFASSGRTTAQSALYDRVYGFFITDGTFRTAVDRPVATSPADGLFIRGSVIAAQVDFNRDLGQTHNNAQPAEVIEYDPLYWVTFGSDLSIRILPIREQ
jgi:hypothetical protein